MLKIIYRCAIIDKQAKNMKRNIALNISRILSLWTFILLASFFLITCKQRDNSLKDSQSYKITYKLNGGTNNPDNPDSYTPKTKDIALKPATRDGYDFINWFDNKDFEHLPIKKIKKGSMGNKKLWAKWSKKINFPHIFIRTENDEPIVEKKKYLNASINFKGYGFFPDKNINGKIRGRGNSSWRKYKKPYKIKLNDKTELAGMKKAKKWVLLANYLDVSLMRNAVAMQIGKGFGLEYTNNIIPVNLSINGRYLGQYNLTEQIEVKKNRIEAMDDILLELDAYYDKDYKFKSKKSNLPVMFKSPKKPSTELFNSVKAEINNLDNLIDIGNFSETNGALNILDKDSLAKYILVYLFTQNEEINYPRSTYMYKDKTSGKYKMGPIWDFDWAFGYNPLGQGIFFSKYDSLVFESPAIKPGTKFFSKLMSDPTIKTALKTEWKNYRKNKFSDLLQFADDYYNAQKKSKTKDYEVWKIGIGKFDTEYNALKTWIKKRAEFLDKYIESL